MRSRKENLVLLFDDFDEYRKALGIHLTAKGYDVIDAPHTGEWPDHMHRVCSLRSCDSCSNAVIFRIDAESSKGMESLDKMIGQGCKADNIAVILDRGMHDEVSRAEKLGIRIFYSPIGLSEVREWIDGVFSTSRSDTEPASK